MSNHDRNPSDSDLALSLERDQRRSGAIASILIGVIAATIGIAITMTSHQAAVDAGGGSYVIAYGPVAFGVILVFRGLGRLLFG